MSLDSSGIVFVNNGLNRPLFICFDNSGNLYCSNIVSNKIIKINPQGFVYDFASELRAPTNLAFDNSGNLYCLTRGFNPNDRKEILKINPQGFVSTFFVISERTELGLVPASAMPLGIAFDNLGNLYYSDSILKSIFKITPLGIISTFASGLDMPTCLAFDNLGNLYYSDSILNSIFKITPLGIISTFADVNNYISDLAFDNLGNLYCSNFLSNNILKIDPLGKISNFATGLSNPLGLTFDVSGNLYCVNNSNNSIIKYNNSNSPTITNFYPNGITQTRQYDTPPFNFTLTEPSSNSAGTFSYSITNSSVSSFATVTGNIVTVNNAGSGIIVATQAASGNYSSGTAQTTLLVSNICFPAGTLVKTDQGIIAIEKINSDIHTINGKKIVGVTQTISSYDFLICFEKHALKNNVPSQKTFMTHGHGVYFNGKMRRAIDFINTNDNVYKVKYRGEVLYNVLMEEHEKMEVHNMTCETLNPENPIAKLYKRLKNLSPEQQIKIAKEYNEFIIKNNNFSQKQLKHLNKCL